MKFLMNITMNLTSQIDARLAQAMANLGQGSDVWQTAFFIVLRNHLGHNDEQIEAFLEHFERLCAEHQPPKDPQ